MKVILFSIYWVAFVWAEPLKRSDIDYAQATICYRSLYQALLVGRTPDEQAEELPPPGWAPIPGKGIWVVDGKRSQVDGVWIFKSNNTYRFIYDETLWPREDQSFMDFEGSFGEEALQEYFGADPSRIGRKNAQTSALLANFLILRMSQMNRDLEKSNQSESRSSSPPPLQPQDQAQLEETFKELDSINQKFSMDRKVRAIWDQIQILGRESLSPEDLRIELSQLKYEEREGAWLEANRKHLFEGGPAPGEYPDPPIGVTEQRLERIRDQIKTEGLKRLDSDLRKFWLEKMELTQAEGERSDEEENSRQESELSEELGEAEEQPSLSSEAFVQALRVCSDPKMGEKQVIRVAKELIQKWEKAPLSRPSAPSLAPGSSQKAQ